MARTPQMNVICYCCLGFLQVQKEMRIPDEGTRETKGGGHGRGETGAQVCGQVAPGDVAEEVRLQRSKTFSSSLVQKATIPLNLYIMVCTSIIGHGRVTTVCKTGSDGW